jgi:hypothetical protein
MNIALDEDTRRQLNRLEAMLNEICAREGIIPSTLPGWEPPLSALPSSPSVASSSAPLERLQITDAVSEPPRKIGKRICTYSTSSHKSDLCSQPEAAPQSEGGLVGKRAQATHVGLH